MTKHADMVTYVDRLVFPKISVHLQYRLQQAKRPVAASKNNVEQKNTRHWKGNSQTVVNFIENVHTASLKWNMLATLNAKPCRIMTHVSRFVLEICSDFDQTLDDKVSGEPFEPTDNTSLEATLCGTMTDTFNVSENGGKLRSACNNYVSKRCIVGWNSTPIQYHRALQFYLSQPASAPHARYYQRGHRTNNRMES
jgi:hypothetical protein